MNTPIVSWLMGGALIASLGWNALQCRRDRAPANTDERASCAAAAARLGDLGLAGAQREALHASLTRCDTESARLDTQARALAAKLQALLVAPAADADAIRAAAKELGAVRAEAVVHCVESSLELRPLLQPDQLKRLLDACCEEGCAGGSCGTGCDGE